MAKKWIAINLVLLVAVIMLGRELRYSVQAFITENNPVRIQPTSEERQAVGDTAAIAGKEDLFANVDYSTISDHTIFSDLRGKDVVEPAVAAPPMQPMAQNQRPILVGTIMVDDNYQALMIDPTTPVRGGRRIPETRRIGDVYRGYTITRIAAGQVVMENGARSETIEFSSNPQRPVVPNVRAAAGATRVVPIGPGGTGGSGITVVTTATQTPVRNVPAAQNTPVRPGAPVGNQQNISVVNGGAVANRQPAAIQQEEIAPTAPQPPQTIQNQPQPAKPAPGRGQQRIIRSPFGDIVRPGSE